MAKNYAALANDVISALGGKENIVAVTHCMTRLRFVLKDESLTDAARLKSISGVLGVVRNDNQCQVIIGNTVSQAYREVVSLLPADLQPAVPEGPQKLTLRRVGAGILDALIGTMSPLIPAIIGGSMVKLLAMILEMTGVLPKGAPTLTILTVIGDGAFFFLPLMVAASAAVKFKTNMSLAIAIAGVLVHPSFIELMAKAAQGEHVEFAFIPVTAVKYTYTVIPALVMTWCLSYIERWVDRITPAVTKNFLKPMLIVLIAAPLAIVLIGPLGIWIGSAISALVYTIHGYLGWLSVAIMGALWPLLVMTGMPELRQTALAAAASAIMAGISEPALYGVAVRLKRPLIASLISGFICGAVAGMAGLASHSMAAPGLFTSVQFFDPANPMTIVWVFGVMGPVEDEAEKARALQTAPVQNNAAKA
ncbi:MAG: PTS transporter subunit EIIC [Enterobacter asburiae]|nr:PTS transporter subunit EIIC [Enterobacter asburiae]